MTTNQTPADPTAYRVTFERNAAGSVHHIEVETLRAPRASYRYGPDEIDELIACAREEERSDRYDDRLPSDHAFICAVLRAHGLPILGEEDDDVNWRDIPVLVQVDGAEDRLVLAGAFADANAEEPGLAPTLRELIRGDVDWCRFGGGAAPLVQVVRAIENPDFDSDVLNVFKHLIAKVAAADALLEAARDLMRDWDSPDLNDASPIAEKFDAIRAAIAKAEG